MTQSRTMTFSIYRFNPETDQKPSMSDYQLDISLIKGKMLLNALEALKEKHPEIGFRRSCGEGVCGSDGMNINGKNGLACITQLHDLPDRVVLMPLPGFPVVRDLIVDMEPFFDQYKRVKPYLQNKAPLPEKERGEIKEKIIRKVKAELQIRMAHGYGNLDLEGVERITEEILKKIRIEG